MLCIKNITGNGINSDINRLYDKYDISLINNARIVKVKRSIDKAYIFCLKREKDQNLYLTRHLSRCPRCGYDLKRV